MTDYPELGITVERAEWLYSEAGELVEEDKPQISLQIYGHLLSDEVDLIIKEVLAETRLTMKLQDFQLLTLHCLGNKRNVVLVNPTGSGKMLCAYLAPLVLRKVFNKEKGVGVGTMPLSAVMDEKLKSEFNKTGLITMQGGLKTNESEEASLSDPLESFQSGEIELILGHAESWSSSTAKCIVNALNKEQLILFLVVDEFQMNLSSHWGNEFR